MKDGDDAGLTIVGGRPNPGGPGASGISEGLAALLQRLAENPGLARGLVMNPEQTLAAEGLELTPTELAMLQHLELQDLGRTRDMTPDTPRGVMRDKPRRATRGEAGARTRGGPRQRMRDKPLGLARGLMARLKGQPDSAEEERQRLAEQLELVAPFVGDPGFYMGERTRGIRPQSIYPTPFAVVEALIRTSEDFRAAILQDAQAAIMEWPELPLNDQERQALQYEVILKRLELVARDKADG
jgi:hypothetical protein